MKQLPNLSKDFRKPQTGKETRERKGKKRSRGKDGEKNYIQNMRMRISTDLRKIIFPFSRK